MQWITYITAETYEEKEINGKQVIDIKSEGRNLRNWERSELDEAWFKSLKNGEEVKAKIIKKEKDGRIYYNFYPYYF